MADITSANVVGYNTKDLNQNKLSMIAVTFDGVDGLMKFNTGLKVEGATGATGMSEADNLLLWDPTLAGGAGGYVNFWYYDDTSEAGWCDEDGNYIEDGSTIYKDGFPAGTAFWYQPIDGVQKKMTFSGAVEGAAYVEPPLSGGTKLSMFASAYPTMLKLNDENSFVHSGMVGATGMSESDNILLWDSTLAGGAGGYMNFWYYDDGSEAGWCDEEGNYIEDGTTIFKDGFPIGTAFWLQPVSSGERTIRFINPIKK